MEEGTGKASFITPMVDLTFGTSGDLYPIALVIMLFSKDSLIFVDIGRTERNLCFKSKIRKKWLLFPFTNLRRIYNDSRVFSIKL